MEIKGYLVFKRKHVFRDGEPNREIIAARLTRKAADAIVERTPGTYVQKVYLKK